MLPTAVIIVIVFAIFITYRQEIIGYYNPRRAAHYNQQRLDRFKDTVAAMVRSHTLTTHCAIERYVANHLPKLIMRTTIDPKYRDQLVREIATSVSANVDTPIK